MKTAKAGVAWGSQTQSLCLSLVTPRRDSDGANISFQLRATARFWHARYIGWRKGAAAALPGNPMWPPALAVRVCIDPEWHCGTDKEGDQEAKSGEGLREIHSGNASVPTYFAP